MLSMYVINSVTVDILFIVACGLLAMSWRSSTITCIAFHIYKAIRKISMQASE